MGDPGKPDRLVHELVARENTWNSQKTSGDSATAAAGTCVHLAVFVAASTGKRAAEGQHIAVGQHRLRARVHALSLSILAEASVPLLYIAVISAGYVEGADSDVRVVERVVDSSALGCWHFTTGNQ